MFKRISAFWLFIFVAFFPSLFVTSCTSKESSKEISRCELIGEMEHTQYWDSHDRWDLSGLEILIYYIDETTKTLSINSSGITYSMYPAQPRQGAFDLRIFDIIYLRDGIKYEVPERTFKTTIVPYPYKDLEKSMIDKSIITLIISTTLIASGFAVFSILCWRKTSKKKASCWLEIRI